MHAIENIPTEFGNKTEFGKSVWIEFVSKPTKLVGPFGLVGKNTNPNNDAARQLKS